ncbi:MAG: DNA repair protein RecN, partial [Clostridiales bacterium]
DDSLIISRELIRGGRSMCRINGRAVNLSFVKEAGKLLINIHGQHEHMQLLEEDKQLQLLDSFGGNEQLAARENVATAYTVLRTWQSKLSQYRQEKTNLAQKLDWLSFQINEIEAVAPQEGEDTQLLEEATRLAHGEKLLTLCQQTYSALDEGGIASLGDAATAFRQVASLDDHASPLLTRLDALYYEAEDLLREIAHYQDGISIDSYRQEEVESRLSQLGKLKNKYGSTLNQVIDFLATAKEEYNTLTELETSEEELLAQTSLAETNYYHKAEYLSLLRKKTALMLAEAISGELQKLAMPQALFRIDLPPTEISPRGQEKALFMICSNTGEDFKPVTKIASGGELSRIILGMKVILSQLDKVPTLIFDEVDVGLSGRALSSVAERLKAVGENAQTIVVSHAAVMAAAADHQINISKKVEAGRTIIFASTLTGTKRETELARMIAGNNVTATTLQQAKEMLATWQPE